MPSRNAGNLIDRRSAPSLRSQPLSPGSAASTCSSDNTAMSVRYTVSGDGKPDRRGIEPKSLTYHRSSRLGVRFFDTVDGKRSIGRYHHGRSQAGLLRSQEGWKVL